MSSPPDAAMATGTDARLVRVVLPSPLRALANAPREVHVTVRTNDGGALSLHRVIDAVEAQYPMLRGTIRDHATRERRAFVRFYACNRDLSHESLDGALPDPVADGTEPLLIVGAMAGG